jgi:hypothetical protein
VYTAIDRKDRDHEAVRRFLEKNSVPLIATDIEVGVRLRAILADHR